MIIRRNSDPINYVPMVSIRPNGVCLYKEFINKRVSLRDESEIVRSERAEQTINESSSLVKEERGKRCVTNGRMSERAIRRMKNSIGWLMHLSKDRKVYSRDLKKSLKFRVSFITVTLSSDQVHDDNKIKKDLFRQLLIELKQTCGMKEYIWRAEKQFNGNIHFHLLTNVFVDHSVLRSKWNRIQNKLGYVDRYSERMERSISCFSDYYNRFINQGSYMQLRKRYLEGCRTGWKSPNSTDVHSLKRVKNIYNYLCKYMCKDGTAVEGKAELNDDSLKVTGKLWGLSENLSGLRSVNMVLTDDALDELNTLYVKKGFRFKVGDYFEFLAIKISWFYKLGLSCFIRCIEEHLHKLGFYNSLCL